jgi:tetratricopeptide (TPR) repeat protein
MTSSMTEALTGLARNHYMNRNYEEAARIYDRVVGDSRSSVPALHYLYANTLFHLGEFARAEDQYRLALREEMLSNPRVHFNLAQVLLRQAKYEEARRIFMDIMDEYDDYPDVIQRCQLVLVYMDRFGGKSVESGFAPVKGE